MREAPSESDCLTCFFCLWKGKEGREDGVGASHTGNLNFSTPASLLIHLRTCSSFPMKASFKAKPVTAIFSLCSEMLHPHQPLSAPGRIYHSFLLPGLACHGVTQSHIITDTASISLFFVALHFPSSAGLSRRLCVLNWSPSTHSSWKQSQSSFYQGSNGSQVSMTC